MISSLQQSARSEGGAQELSNKAPLFVAQESSKTMKEMMNLASKELRCITFDTLRKNWDFIWNQKAIGSAAVAAHQLEVCGLLAKKVFQHVVY